MTSHFCQMTFCIYTVAQGQRKGKLAPLSIHIPNKKLYMYRQVEHFGLVPDAVSGAVAAPQ